VKQILGCSWAKAFYLVKEYSTPEREQAPQWVPLANRKIKIDLPPLSAPLVGPGAEYLRSRSFDPEVIAAEYGVKEIGGLGDEYRFRLIIPVYVDNTLVTFTTRKYIESKEPKAIDQPVEEAAIPCKNCLYNIDTVKDQAIIVEGPADVWKLGEESVALFGTACSAEQQKLLIDRGVKRVFIMLDPGAERPAEKLYFSLISIIREIKIIKLRDLDQGDMTQEAALNLKIQLLYSLDTKADSL
jgi:hypothetical protein